LEGVCAGTVSRVNQPARPPVQSARVSDVLGAMTPRDVHTIELGSGAVAVIDRALDILERYLDMRGALRGGRA